MFITSIPYTNKSYDMCHTSTPMCYLLILQMKIYVKVTIEPVIISNTHYGPTISTGMHENTIRHVKRYSVSILVHQNSVLMKRFDRSLDLSPRWISPMKTYVSIQIRHTGAHVCWCLGIWVDIKFLSCQYRNYHYGDKMILQQHHNFLYRQGIFILNLTWLQFSW